jgi:hypothetical protein
VEGSEKSRALGWGDSDTYSPLRFSNIFQHSTTSSNTIPSKNAKIKSFARNFGQSVGELACMGVRSKKMFIKLAFVIFVDRQTIALL